ncbi:MAG: DUF4147 domain-containing protein [Patescibacteria group bacterium]|nr:DUF4147 domain-containing protein [Patescibacteria group bacterium]
MKIRNYDKIATTPLRTDALDILDAGLEAIDTAAVIAKNISLDNNILTVAGESVPLKDVKRVFVIGIGKCALEAGAAVEKILGHVVTGGIILDVQAGNLHKIQSLVGTHPFPSEQNIDATREIIRMLSDTREDDLVLMLISGGGSALLCQPGNFTCQNETVIVECLMGSGVPITEMNTVRKHLSGARGGFLAQYAYPARVISLIFSDVPGNNLEFVASGPTVPDTTTIADAEKIIERNNVWKKCAFGPVSLIETPKDRKYFERVKNILLVSNTTALEAMQKTAEEKGYATRIVSDAFSGEARAKGPEMASAIAREPAHTALLYGGETTVTLTGHAGNGGRNQELALSALAAIGDDELVISLASDGRDNTDHAGGIADALTREHARKLSLDPAAFMANDDSYSFFTKTGDYILTGNTGSNVSDILIAIKG